MRALYRYLCVGAPLARLYVQNKWNKERERERKDRVWSSFWAGLSRMLNLVLVPVWCGLHINDGGISASNQPPASEAAACTASALEDSLIKRTDRHQHPGRSTMAAVQASNNKSRFQPTGSVSNSSLCSWREISGYREHSETASLWWTGWKLAEISH